MSEKAVCPICRGTCYIDTPALAFLHQQVHSEPMFLREQNLRQLPYALFERVSRLMEDFSESQRRLFA